MIIYEEGKPITTVYKKLACGDIIKHDGQVYMKTKEGKSMGSATDIIFTYNAICLDDGGHAYFDPASNVIPITNYVFKYSI